MSKTKKSGKSARIPQPIKVKKEKTEEDRAIHSMTHYVDDRLELVKQIFGSLKTKTITNLAPEFLKTKEMNEIQELCLNELLCLSKKRLQSIINSTKCPTDTESSEDTDVEAEEEHISLEEISSDSEIESGGGGKVAKKSATQSRTKKNSKKLNQANDKGPGGGQISVLELLELQARARAIRSQLALEPVTKIEIDSDEENAANANVTSTTKEQKNIRKRKKMNSETPEKQNPRKSSLKTATSTSNDDADKQSNTTNNGQKLKLKRNFRKPMPDSPEANGTEDQLINQGITKELKKEKLSRSPSPDVVPIEPEPETLCITDSSSDSEEVKEKPTTDLQPKVLENQLILTSAVIPEEKEVEEEEEAEDGEIIESETENNIEAISTVEAENKEEISEPISKATNVETKCEEDPSRSEQQSSLKQNCPASSNGNNETAKEVELPKIVEDVVVLSPVHIHDSDDQSDDVISIEGGDLENEMSEHLEEETNSKCSGSNSTTALKEPTSDTEENDCNDIISLESSDNQDDSTQEHNDESWQSRYLKSNRVSKVLAVSRLGKRVRDKLRNSKLSKKDAIEEMANVEKTDNKFTSKHEEGSVEQYKELLELTQHKS